MWWRQRPGLQTPLLVDAAGGVVVDLGLQLQGAQGSSP